MLNYKVVIIGSGAAGYAAADRLLSFGVDNIAIVTESRTAGTSRNAGSDKQTYYKLSCTDLDSPQKMAEDLSFGGGMHGDTAFIEASNSLRCFLHLADYGVPFPTDDFGRYVGYRTDHDSMSRGTSAGPLTSKYMTEALEKRVLESRGVTLIDRTRAVRIVSEQNHAVGIIGLRCEGVGYSLVSISAEYIILATGGAAGLYRDSVYPKSQSGALGLAVDAGCRLNNITEWQYGIASTKVRWNLSGSYQQVIPRYYSVDASGIETEFLSEAFGSATEALNAVFLKGYQWPFDSRKTDGSSKVDLAVHAEIIKGRRVFMDFRSNPMDFDLSKLSDEAQNYLRKSNAVCDTPIDRLQVLNPKAVEFYKSHGIDLASQPLEIAVCAQHMNGGVDVDCDWQTNVEGLFAVGETAGTFGMYRPGGSALNSTQVGALRAAEYIARQPETESCGDRFTALESALREEGMYIENCLKSGTDMTDFSGEMSACAAQTRVYEDIEKLSGMIDAQRLKRYYTPRSNDFKGVLELYRYRDNLTAQAALCKSLLCVIPEVGSRGGAVCFKDGRRMDENILYREYAVQTVGSSVEFVPLRPEPDSDYHFETVWHRFESRRKNGE